MGKEKSKKEKEKNKSKKEKKDKKHKKHRRRSSSDSSDSDGSVEGANQRLARERAAVCKLRDILSTFPAVRKELREMLWRVDQGEAANISTVPDPDLKANLAQLLELLRLRRNEKGIYGLINRSEKILPVVGFVFDEPPRPQPRPAPAPAPAAAPVAAAASAAPPTASASGLGGSGTKSEPDAPPRRSTGPIGPVRPAPAPDDEDPDRGPSSNRDADRGSDQEAAAAAAAAVGAAAARVKDEEQQAGGSGKGMAAAAVVEGPVAPRRVAGPAMPPRELLDAAAAAAEALRAAGPPGSMGLSYGDSDDDGDLVGPPPPELVEELEGAPQDEREAEVVRIIRVLREHTAAAGGPKKGQLAPSGPDAAGAAADAYSVLGVESSAGAGEVKKRYMRLSLLIHPDKCGHPLAHEAFQAVATSAKVLQDSSARSALDERRADAELRRRAEAVAEQQERERAWRVARGEEAPGGPAGPMGLSGPQRDTWMTDLPPEVSTRPGAEGVSQTSVRAFSQRGKTGRGDTSAWTDNPEQRRAREAQALLTAASQAYIHALPAAGGPLALGGGGGGAAATALDTFNAGSRKKSLMEVHLELQEKAKQEARAAKKTAKKQKTGDAAAAKGAAAGGGGGGGSGEGAADGGQDWPWRPFDRDRDLAIKPQAKTGSDILKSAAALGNKFSGGPVQRHFL